MAAVPKPIIYLDAGGESRPVRFGFNALATFTDLANLSLQDMTGIETKLTARQLEMLIWAGFRDGARKEQMEFTATVDDVGDWIDEDEQFVTRVLEHFAASQSTGEEDGGKKRGARVR